MLVPEGDSEIVRVNPSSTFNILQRLRHASRDDEGTSLGRACPRVDGWFPLTDRATSTTISSHTSIGVHSEAAIQVSLTLYERTLVSDFMDDN